MSQQEVVVRLVLVGDSCTGKTSLLLRYVENVFSPSFISTVGIDFRMKTIMVGDTKVKVQIFDTAGQERFRTITKAYYRNADGALLLYDITNIKSFEHISEWAEDMEPFVQNEFKVLVGNKSDLKDSRVVTPEQGKKLAQTLGYHFKETSALNGHNVDEVFTEMLHGVLRNKNVKGEIYWNNNDSNNSNNIVHPGDDVGEKSGCFC